MPIKTGHDLPIARIAAAYAAGDEVATVWPADFYARVLALAGDVTGRRVAEIGCGRGGFLAAATAGGAVVHGSELVTVHAADARRHAPAAHVVLADVQAGLPYAAASVDLVVAMEVLEHLRDPARCFAEARRILKPGGALVVSVPNATGYAPFHLFGRLVPGRWLRRKLLPYEHPVNTRQPIDTMYRFAEILALVEKNGFDIEALAGYRYFRWAYGFPLVRSVYASLAPRLERWLAARKLHRFAYHVIVRARPRPPAARGG